jgi:hypothetical protein
MELPAVPPAAVIVGRKEVCLGWRRRFVGVAAGAGVPVAVADAMPVGVLVGALVRVVVGVAVVAFVVTVGVLVRVLVGVVVGVGVAVVPPVGVLVGVPLGVGVQAGIRTAPDPELNDGEVVPESLPEASISSVKKEIVAWQAGAVSSTLPSQMSPEVPFGCSVVTGFSPILQGTAVGELP